MEPFGAAALAEGQETVRPHADIDKGGVERRFDPAHAAAIDLAFDGTLAGLAPAVQPEFDHTAVLDDRGAGFADIFLDQDAPVHASSLSPMRSVTG